MIRSNLPIPFLYRLRSQASSAANRAHSSLVTYRQRSTASGGRPVNARQAAARRAPTSAVAALWLEFIEQYERFTDVLCASAKSGCDSHKESEYAQLRRWFVANYYRIALSIRPYLEAEFLAESAAGAGLPMIVDYAGQKRTLDVLEALFLPASLREVLKHDGGELIPRIARVSEAVYRCHADWEEGQSA